MRYLLLTSFIWAFSFGLIGNVLDGLNPLMVASSRLVIALIIFLPFLRCTKLAESDQLKFAGIGAVQFGIMYVCYLSAFRFIPSHLVALFSVLTPLYVVLIHDVRQRQFHTRYLFAALLSVAGAAAIKAKGGETESIWIGFALMQISGLSFAFGQVAYRDKKRELKTIKDRDVFALLYAGGAATALLATLFIVPEPGEFLQASHSQLGVILYLGVIASGVGFFLWNKGAALCSAGILAVFNNALIPIAMIVSLFVFGEIEGASPTDLIRLLTGALLITVAVFIGKSKATN